MSTDGIKPIAEPFRRGFGVRAWHDWDSFLPRMNWRDFSLIHVGGEVNPTTERVELTLCALGLWLEIYFAWGTAFYERIGAMRDDFRARHNAGTPDVELSHIPSTPTEHPNG